MGIYATCYRGKEAKCRTELKTVFMEVSVQDTWKYIYIDIGYIVWGGNIWGCVDS
jgi:hypothetical protein